MRFATNRHQMSMLGGSQRIQTAVTEFASPECTASAPWEESNHMAAKDRAEQGAHQGAALIEALRQNPYVLRLLEDEDLRDQLKDAVENSRSAYKRAAKAKSTPQALLKDKKLQK